ncbi:toprim domain-containing protein [Solitalea lacus]|uniref:toprim domain-containing protein n=1 Tax=Solitalea lacus TaxID=2911172 RepID=UPI001EDC7E3F|nr:toprim domain-containing protein [Solitalea lacus]UKJ07932.1 CHC2 zinc finger domain-containing protein [Solitalea lacus]
MKKLKIRAAKQIDLVDYLASLNHLPQKTRNQDYWYLSPLRAEQTPSFKINRKLIVWYDHGLGQGGNLIDFGILFFKCSVSDFLERLAQHKSLTPFSFHPPLSLVDEKKNTDESKIVILNSRSLADRSLTDYLQSRCIPLQLASSSCKEVDFLLYGKMHTAIGFQNNSGGYEFRNKDFKGCCSPKDFTLFENNSKEINVFEGFFNYLSFLTINHRLKMQSSNFLILNSLSFLKKAVPIIDKHDRVNLYLDRDPNGIQNTQQLLKLDERKYIDQSLLYQNHNDLNDWLIHKKQDIKHSQRIGRKL